MTHTLRQKINEYAGKVPYIGNALTTEISGTGILAGALAAGMLYSSMARAEPYVDTRSALIKNVNGQVCLDTDKIQFHLDSQVPNSIFGEMFSKFVAKALLRRGYDATEGSGIIQYRDGKSVVYSGSDDKLPHLFLDASEFYFDAAQRSGRFGLELSVQNSAGRAIYVNEDVFKGLHKFSRFEVQPQRDWLENALPPSCAALRDGRVKPSVSSTTAPEQKDCVCPPVPVCEPGKEEQSTRMPATGRLGDYMPTTPPKEKCFDVDTLPIRENAFRNRPEDVLNNTYQKFHAALVNYLATEVGYKSLTFWREEGQPSGPHLNITHSHATVGNAFGTFQLEARKGGNVVRSSILKYGSSVEEMQLNLKGAVPPRCPRKTTVKVK